MGVRLRLTGLFVLLTFALAVAGFVGVMIHLAGLLALCALPLSAVCAFCGWLALGAPRTRKDRRLSELPSFAGRLDR